MSFYCRFQLKPRGSDRPLGRACRNVAMLGSDFCSRHQPEAIARRRQEVEDRHKHLPVIRLGRYTLEVGAWRRRFPEFRYDETIDQIVEKDDGRSRPDPAAGDEG